MCTTAGTGQSTGAIRFDMEPHSTKTVLFPVVPLETGKSKLKVRMTTTLLTEVVYVDVLIEVGIRCSATCYSMRKCLDQAMASLCLISFK